MELVYKTEGTCSTHIELIVDGDVVKEVAFWGGCNGNLQGLSRLVKDMNHRHRQKRCRHLQNAAAGAVHHSRNQGSDHI